MGRASAPSTFLTLTPEPPDRGASGSCSSSDSRYRTHPRRNSGQVGTVGIRPVGSGNRPKSAGWCQHSSWPELSRCMRMPSRSFLISTITCSREHRVEILVHAHLQLPVLQIVFACVRTRSREPGDSVSATWCHQRPPRRAPLRARVWPAWRCPFKCDPTSAESYKSNQLIRECLRLAKPRLPGCIAK